VVAGPHGGNKHGADKTKAYKPVTFRPTDILPSAESPLSKGVTPFPPGSSSVAANGIGLPVAAGDSVPNGNDVNTDKHDDIISVSAEKLAECNGR
jgi:hypothetical protein